MYREPAVKYTVPFLCVYFHICPRHPWAARAVSCREVIKRLAADQLHRNLTSPWFSPGCPHCVFLFLQGCGWAEVSLSLLLSLPYRKQSDIYKPIVLALTFRMNRQNKWLCISDWNRPGVLLMWLMLSHRQQERVWWMSILFSRYIQPFSLAVSKLYLFWTQLFMTLYGGSPTVVRWIFRLYASEQSSWQ